MDNNIIYNINSICNEIIECFDNDSFFAALSMSLMLPDICAKVQSSNRKGNRLKNNKDIYSAWCDEWMEPYFRPLRSQVEFLGMSWGQVIYYLRCSILHNGEIDVCNKDYKYIDLKNFNIYVRPDKTATTGMSTFHDYSSGNIFPYKNEYSININLKYLIDGILYAVSSFIATNNFTRENFPSLNISISDLPEFFKNDIEEQDFLMERFKQLDKILENKEKSDI